MPRTTPPRRTVSRHEDVKTKVSYLRSTGIACEWSSVENEAAAGATPEEVKKAQQLADSNRKQLTDYLHSVLTTPNLIILAGSGASLGKVGGPSMQTLWEEVSKLPDFANVIASVKHDVNDMWIENLLSRCRIASEFLDGDKTLKVSDFISSAEKIIHKLCSEFLTNADLDGHQTFLRRLARRRLRAPRLKIFTTNYDLCFETAASGLGIVVIDGFSFSIPRRFDPRYFTFDVVHRAKASDEGHNFIEGVIQLFKLHGSVNWDDTEKGIIQSAEPKSPCLIYPTSTKYEQSYSQPHLELMSQFQSALREPNTCLITVGFGFSDNHLSAPIISAINSNPSFKVLAVDKAANAKSALDKGVYSELRKKISSGEADIALINAGFGQFAELIPHLKALSPAEQIERSVRQIALGS